MHVEGKLKLSAETSFSCSSSPLRQPTFNNSIFSNLLSRIEFLMLSATLCQNQGEEKVENLWSAYTFC